LRPDGLQLALPATLTVKVATPHETPPGVLVARKNGKELVWALPPSAAAPAGDAQTTSVSLLHFSNAYQDEDPYALDRAQEQYRVALEETKRFLKEPPEDPQDIGKVGYNACQTEPTDAELLDEAITTAGILGQEARYGHW